MSAEQRRAFENLLRGGGQEPEDSQLVCEEWEGVPEPGGQRQNVMVMDGFTLRFSGAFSRDMLYNSLSSIIPDGTEVCLEINCKLEGV